MQIWINEIKEILDELKIPYENYFDGGSAIRFKVRDISISNSLTNLTRKGDLTVEIDNAWIAVGDLKEDNKLHCLEDKTIFYLYKEKVEDRVEFKTFCFVPNQIEERKFDEIPEGYTFPSIFVEDYLKKSNKESINE